MKKTGLFLMIAAGFSVSLLLSGCGIKNVMKQDPKRLEQHCKDPKYKDAKICKYLSKRDQHDSNLVGLLYEIRDAGLVWKKRAEGALNDGKKYSLKWKNCELGRASAEEKHDEELAQLGFLKK